MSEKHYGAEFYEGQKGASYTAAEEVLPTVFGPVRPESIVDFGCGVGTWLAVARRLGAKDALGLEGSWISAKDLIDPEISFMNANLEQPIALDRRFDLAMSMEVAEHLSEGAAGIFVSSLCAASDVILFSAAILGQGGRSHKNEQWQSYWAERFASEGYEAVDLVRPAVWHNEKIPWYYRQNALVYIRKASDRGRVLLEKIGPTQPFVLDVVHPDLFRKRTSFRGGLGTVKRAVIGSVRKSGGSPNGG